MCVRSILNVTVSVPVQDEGVYSVPVPGLSVCGVRPSVRPFSQQELSFLFVLFITGIFMIFHLQNC